MKKITFPLIVSIVFLSGCTVLYSTPGTWKQSDSQIHQFTAETRLGLTGRKVNIFNNGKLIMSGKAKYWSKRITMTAQLNEKPVAAVCGSDTKECIITAAGEEIAKLSF